MISTLPGNLAGFSVIFLMAWVLYFASHVALVRMGVLRGVGKNTVALAGVAALASGGVAWLMLGRCFSSPDVHALASITAPFAFLGFCGIYVLIGPVTVDRSITMTILLALEGSESKRLKRDQLEAQVPFDRLFSKRLRELEGSGVIDTSGDLAITPRGRRAIRFYKWLARTFDVDFQ